MPPAAPPIWGTRSKMATHRASSGVRGTPRIRPDDQHAQPGDARHQHRSGHVAADGLVGQPADAVGLGPPGEWHQPAQPPDQPLAVEQQADGDQEGEEGGDEPVGHPAGRRRRAGVSSPSRRLGRSSIHSPDLVGRARLGQVVAHDRAAPRSGPPPRPGRRPTSRPWRMAGGASRATAATASRTSPITTAATAAGRGRCSRRSAAVTSGVRARARRVPTARTVRARGAVRIRLVRASRATKAPSTQATDRQSRSTSRTGTRRPPARRSTRAATRRGVGAGGAGSRREAGVRHRRYCTDVAVHAGSGCGSVPGRRSWPSPCSAPPSAGLAMLAASRRVIGWILVAGHLRRPAPPDRVAGSNGACAGDWPCCW